MRLHELRDKPGATQKRKRVGRGPGSGSGKTAGRGNKGQKSRSGVALDGFEGGQMPIYQRLPKRGFRNPNVKRHAVINIGQLQSFIDAGRLDASKPIDEAALIASGLVRRRRDGIRLLAKGEITAKAELIVTGVSKPAAARIEAVGGSVQLVGRGTKNILKDSAEESG
ncbi:MAG: 50S ribosomal protein L15 [Rhodobacteraceae bacterium]|nr:50S ribosomal protein L15 [Paracoccaceae bacterium]